VGDAQGYYTLPVSTVSSGDAQITAQYNALTHQIVVNNVSAASGGFISLEGAILSTNTLGEINVNSDLGQVTVSNQTNFPIVVNDISASKSTASTSLSGVDIIDTNQPAATQQTLYVYQPGNFINVYRGTASQSLQQLKQGTPAVISGNSTTYSPETGLRWEWQLQSTLTRDVHAVDDGTNVPPFSESAWVFSPAGLPQNDPWYYLPNVPNADISDGTSQPNGWTVVAPGLPDFEETISGSVQNWETGFYIYHNGNFGFQPTDPAVQAPPSDPKAGQLEDPWVYYFATEAELTLTNSVKADNPIGIHFSGPATAVINIVSDQPVMLAGNLSNPLGLTQISAPGITQTASASTIAGNLNLVSSGGGVGTAAQPLSASLTAGGLLIVEASSQGAFLNLSSGASLLGIAGDSSTPGDIVINATGSLVPAPGEPSGTVDLTGNNITLTSSAGAVGTAAAPLEIQASGVVNVSAFGDIGLNQQSGTLNVSQIISTSGDVTIDPDDSPILNANPGMWSSEVGNAESQQVWQDLDLTNPSAAVQQTIAAFENEVNANYAAYWQLINNGSVTSGVFTLNAGGVALYKGRAGLSLSPPTAQPTNAQIQTYANTQYQSYVAFFNLNLAPNWASSPDFQVNDPSFHYVATAQQVADLTSNAAWTTPELKNPAAQVAINPASGNPVGTWTPNISGVNVTLVAPGTGGSIGQTGAATFIALADLQSGNLTAAQLTALGNATAPGDIVEQVTNGQGQILIVPLGQEPAGFTPTGILVSPTTQLFISATGILNLTAGSSIAIQGTTNDLTLGQVTAGAGVNITAQGSIFGTGTGIQISTPGATILKTGTGSVGTPSVPLIVNIGGTLVVYTPPGQAFINGGHPTSVAITATTPSTYGHSVTFTATVSDNGTSPSVPTGNVAFYDGTTYLGLATSHSGSGSSATWTFTTSTLTAGVHSSIIAVYSPSGNFTGSSGSLIETITPAPLTITAKSASKTYGQTATSSVTAFTETGLVSGDSITGVSESSAGALMSATIGTYDIVPFAAAGKGLANYIITYVNGTLTVNPAHLTITANNDSKTYGTLKTFTPTAFTEIGLVTANGDTITGVTETSTGAPVSATVGNYPIALGAAIGNRLDNYLITYVNSTLTVNPAPLTITANNDSKTYGTLKTFSTTAFTQTGLVTVNGDTIIGVTETSTGSPVSAQVGNYPIVPGAATGNRLNNYIITYINGTLTVNPAPLTITANNDSKPFGTVKTFSPTAFTQTGLVTVNGDTITGVTETSAGAPAPAPVGTYPIVPSAATGNRLNNYIITYVSGTLTVNQSIIVLDPTAGGALSLSGNAVITLAGGVFVDSSSSSAFTESGNAKIKAPVIDVHGGVQKSGNASVSPTPIMGAASLPDPLVSLASPGTSGLTNHGSENLSGNSSATIQPGIYSGINVSGNAKLTMNSGLYIIEGGGFSVSGNSSVSGSGVTIFNAGSKYPSTGGTYGSINLSGNGTFSLSPPTTGAYAGVVIFQPADNTSGLSVSGNAASVTGEIYAPKAQLNESGNGQLNASIVVDTMTLNGNGIANLSLGAPTGTVAYTPAQVRTAYGINKLGADLPTPLDGAGQTIAIVDAYDNPNIFKSLDAFDSQFGLTSAGANLYDQYGPASSFLTVLNQSGQAASLPGTGPMGAGTDNWQMEESLDVEWAHAMAPGARIILLEASSQSLSDLMATVATAANQPGVSVVSMSWGFPEGQAVFAGDEATDDRVFAKRGVTFVASTGDSGAADPEYPAYSPNVLSVGGTSLTLNADGSYNSETAWGDGSDSGRAFIGSGGGASAFEPEPAYQRGAQSTGARTTPDVSLVADPATGLWIADSSNSDLSNPFQIVGGTSLSAPAWAGLVALANQGRAAAGESTLNSSTPTEAQQALYMLPRSDYNMIASDSNGHTATAGYNPATGLGTPVVNLLVRGLIAYQGPGDSGAGPTVNPLQHAGFVGGARSNRRGTPSAFNAFNVLTASSSGSSGALSPDAGPATRSATSPVHLTPAVAASTFFAAALGSPFALSLGSFSFDGPAQSQGWISNSSSAPGTSAPSFGATNLSFSTGLAPQLPVRSTSRMADISPSAQDHQALSSGMNRRNLDADAFVVGRPVRGLVAESVLDDAAASLLISRGQDQAAPANAPARRPTGITDAVEAMGSGLQQVEDVPSASSAMGLMVFGLAAGLWARRSGILNARKRRPGCRPSRSKPLDLTPGKMPW
jgi:Bacterial Ig-like domain (group 3)/MBG domain (YGX type)